MKFADQDLSENIQKSLEKMGYTEMTPIQEATWPVIFSGRDLCGLAETGSGKTGACAVPLVAMMDENDTGIQAVIIVPTRELCQQYVSEIQSIADRTAVVPFAVFGGFSRDIQIAKLNHLVHILVATPGRLIDLMLDGAADLSRVKIVILDEADELLNEGFLEDIEFILSCIIQQHQTLLFSATMPPAIKALMSKYLDKPELINLIEDRAAPDSIEHYFKVIDTRKRMKELIGYLEENTFDQVLVFCNSKLRVNKVYDLLKKELPAVEYIHSGLSQDRRSALFWAFKKKKIRVLIATDVAGRGLDFSHVTHVINVDFPGIGENYTHRTGRTGRMGRGGKAVTFVAHSELPALRKLISRKGIKPLWIGSEPQSQGAKPVRSRNEGSGFRKKRRRSARRPQSKRRQSA